MNMMQTELAPRSRLKSGPRQNRKSPRVASPRSCRPETGCQESVHFRSSHNRSTLQHLPRRLETTDSQRRKGGHRIHAEAIYTKTQVVRGRDNPGLGLRIITTDETVWEPWSLPLSSSEDHQTTSFGLTGEWQHFTLFPQNSPFPEPSSPLHNPERRTLACPYNKRDPNGHPDCYRYTLRRLKDVLQHLRRKHLQMLICARCQASFYTLPSFEARERPALCNGLQPHIDAIGNTSETRIIRGNGADEQWMCLWDLLFPDTQRPESPYLESRQKEMALQLNHFWVGNAFDITNEVIQLLPVTWSQQGDTSQLFGIFLQHLLKRFVGPGTDSQVDSGYSSMGTSRRSTFSGGEKPTRESGSPLLFSPISEGTSPAGQQDGEDPTAQPSCFDTDQFWAVQGGPPDHSTEISTQCPAGTVSPSDLRLPVDLHQRT